MKNTFGNSLTVTIFGESHGTAIGAVLDGITPGLPVNTEYITEKLNKRRPSGKISTPRREADEFEILSGVCNGKTTGTPICIVIRNTDTKSCDYEKMQQLARPGHADYTAECKYHGFQDIRGGGHFSGRITAPLVAAGAIVQYALEQKGIFIATHIKECGGVADYSFDDIVADMEVLKKAAFPVINPVAGEKMIAEIEKAREDGDSVGGILQSAIIGVPVGVGEPFFDSLESVFSHALFSIPAIKGVEFGAGFAFADMRGSEANDAFLAQNGKIVTATNNNGGINGGISNGMPIIISCAVKPTPSISKKQQTVNYKSKENAELEIHGRHDGAIIHRAAPAVDSVLALALADMLLSRFGTDYLL